MIFEIDAGETFEPQALFTRCVESGSDTVLLDERSLPADFFDLSTGQAGELLHKLTTYRIPLACVVPDLSIHSARFQDFAREANRGAQYRFFPTREQAVAWLESIVARRG